MLESLDPGIIDAVVGGHNHNIVHHWVNGVPVVQTTSGGYYSHIIYLRFDHKTNKLISDKTLIEGPLPTCEKIFKNTKRCDFIENNVDTGPLVQYSFHNKEILPDKSLQMIFSRWYNEVRKMKEVIGYTEEVMIRVKDKENLLGNFVSDAIRIITNSDFSVYNNGGLRSTWYPGDITVQNLHEMFPIDNIVTTWKMTGSEIKKMMKIIQKGKRGLYQISGLSIKINPVHEVLDIKSYDGSEIIDNKEYTFAGVNFEIPFGGDDFENVISWYQPRDVEYYGLIRDNMINYIRSIKHIRAEDYIDPNHKRIDIVSMNLKNSKPLAFNFLF